VLGRVVDIGTFDHRSQLGEGFVWVGRRDLRRSLGRLGLRLPRVRVRLQRDPNALDRRLVASLFGRAALPCGFMEGVLVVG
jgi:hypothetical protein